MQRWAPVASAKKRSRGGSFMTGSLRKRRKLHLRSASYMLAESIVSQFQDSVFPQMTVLLLIDMARKST